MPAGADPALARDCQLAGGDDYELAFTAAPEKRTELAALAARLDLPLWRIGRVVADDDVADAAGTVRLLDEEGQPVALRRKGFDHFG